ncbi:MAG: glutamyl-tRNA reductase [Candidatus Poriferisodalaceae bacterium]
MSIVVLGVSHRSAPLDLLERCTIAAADLPKCLADLNSREHVSEAVLLSTCNRTEAYVVAEKFHGAFADVRDFFAETFHVAPEDLSDHLYVLHDDAAVEHLFEVTAGVRSAVLGETEILGQTKVAWEQARLEASAGPVLNLLFRHAVETGKRARTETSIGRHTASVSHAAVEMATDRLGSLVDREVLIVGAGEMAEGMVVSLAAAGPNHVMVANRTHERAVELASRVDGDAVPLAELGRALADVDLLLTSTGATSVIVDHASIDEVVSARGGRPLLIVDVAVPRDVDPSVAELPGVTLLDMEDLSKFAARGIEARALEVERVKEIIAEETSRFSDVRSAREMAPIISSLRGQIEAIRQSELERQSSRLDGLDDQQRAAVEAVTRSLVAKLLHGPTIRLKDAAGSPKGDRLADSLRDLFDL